MSEVVSTEIVEVKKEPSVLATNLSILTTPDGFQKYILGTKKNGTPRAVYDVIKDCSQPKKKKKKKKNKTEYNGPTSVYDVFLTGGKKKKKKKGKKSKKNKHWHI